MSQFFFLRDARHIVELILTIPGLGHVYFHGVTVIVSIMNEDEQDSHTRSQSIVFFSRDFRHVATFLLTLYSTGVNSAQHSVLLRTISIQLLGIFRLLSITLTRDVSRTFH